MRILSTLLFILVSLIVCGCITSGSTPNSTPYLSVPEFPTTLSAVRTASSCPKTVKVAVIDTGIDYTHPGLSGSMWENRKELEDGLDNDRNGFEDDRFGWNFVNSTPKAFDFHGHGTHIAGIILGLSRGTTKPYSFVFTKCVPDIRVVNLKYYDNGGFGHNNLMNTIRAIEYATKLGVDIINYSGGGSEPFPNEEVAVRAALAKGILIVAAAGNHGRSNDKIPHFPANYGHKNLLSVAGVNKLNVLMRSSNFGRTVHLAAPGLMVQSTIPDGRTSSMSGTSQATAYVSGLAAILMSMDPKSTADSVKYIMFNTAKKIDGPNTVLYGTVDPVKATETLYKQLNSR